LFAFRRASFYSTYKISNPEMPVCEGMARAGLEITFKFLGLFESFEGDVEAEFPGRVFLDVASGTIIMGFNSFLEIRSLTDIAHPRSRKALQNVGVIHDEDNYV
jgi:hypothetical protein